MNISKFAFAAAALLVAGHMSVAQAQTRIGSVTTIEGPAGSVLVVRGAQTYSLQQGDALFDGDQVFTRSNGSVQLQFTGCGKSLAAASSIVVGPTVCDLTPTTLAGEQVIGGVRVAAVGAGGVGATPGIIAAALAAAGVGAAAGGGDDSPASP